MEVDGSSVFSSLQLRDPDEAFLNAVCKGLKKPYDYMYMYSKDGHDYFKHIVTREYLKFEQEIYDFG
ncbi:MAG: hypothetical protein WC939_02645 [Acholeplasmataceae bacterium]|jgi:hypothetical protein